MPAASAGKHALASNGTKTAWWLERSKWKLVDDLRASPLQKPGSSIERLKYYGEGTIANTRQIILGPEVTSVRSVVIPFRTTSLSASSVG